MNEKNQILKIKYMLTQCIKPVTWLPYKEIGEKYLQFGNASHIEPCSLEKTPYLEELLKKAQDRTTNKIILVSGARSGKTAFTYICISGFLYFGKDAHFITPQHTTADRASDETKRNFLQLNKHLGVVRDVNRLTVYEKGNKFKIDSFNTTAFSAFSTHAMVLSEFDQYKELSEGVPATMRVEGNNGLVIIESTPRYDADSPKTTSKQSLPNTKGIVGHYNQGSRAMFYWTCPRCKKLFHADPEKLTQDNKECFLECSNSNCNHKIPESQKQELNKGGKWIHESKESCKVGSYSYCLNGVYAFNLSWESILNKKAQAHALYEQNGDNSQLREFYNTYLGLPFVNNESCYASRQENINSSNLKRKTVPHNTSFIYASVDAQGGSHRRFEVCIFAYCGINEDKKIVVIDRYSIKTYNEEDIAPHTNSKHLNVLIELANKKYKSEKIKKGNAYHYQEYKPVKVIIDSNGEAGYTQNLTKFFTRLKLEDQKKLLLIKGDGYKRDEITMLSKNAKYQLYLLQVSKLKEILFSRLALNKEDDSGFLFYKDFPDKYKKEIFSEVMEGNKWIKKAIHMSNETLDLLVYGLGFFYIFEEITQKQLDNLKRIFSRSCKDVA